MTTPDHWQRHFAAQRSSGVSITQYCRDNGIRSNKWYYWRNRLKEGAEGTVSLVPVNIASEPSHSGNCRVHLPNGIVLEFGGTYEPARLAGQMMSLGRT